MRARDPRPRRASLARSDRGFTIPELLVASVVTLIVAVAVMGLILVGIRQTENQSDRIAALDSARNGMLRMTTEIRSAAALDSVSQQVVDVEAWVPDPANPTGPRVLHEIRFKCAGASTAGESECTRQDRTAHTPPERLIGDLADYTTENFASPCDNGDGIPDYFCPDPKSNSTVVISILVKVPGAENPIELRDAATVRNCLDQGGQPLPCGTT